MGLGLKGLGNRPWQEKNWKAFRKNYCQETRRLLVEGDEFCDALPYSAFRLRWASMMPLRIGVSTLSLLEKSENWGNKRLKITKTEMQRLSVSTAVETLLGVRQV